MSIKKLFDSANKNRNYSEYSDEKDLFDFVESAENAAQITIKNNTIIPQVDYSKPENFVRFGSAYYFYKGALSKISEFYPYDGSEAEKNSFYNSLLEGEKYIFNNHYPSFTGYGILSADGWGSLNGSKTSDGYGLPASLEYITFKGGPLTSSGTSMVARGPNPESDRTHYSNIYDENIYETEGLPDSYGSGTRLSNLRSDFDDGVTVEFWLKKAAFNNTLTEKEVVLDVWNNYAATTPHYGRITIELTGASDVSPFIITAQSGTRPSSVFTSSIGQDITTASLTSWSHYALTFYNTGSNFIAKLYKDGNLNDTNTYSGNISELNSKGMMGRIGGLLTSPSGSSAAAGAAKLSASLDDFRFWKVARNSQQINRNWFATVDGGANTDISNTTLGIYYKFNEGVTTTASIDSVVLDYAGRLSNGVWTGYDSYSRNTGSAIVSASAAIRESLDPVVRTRNPEYLTLSSSLMGSGSWYDLNNNSSFMNYSPSWVVEEHDESGNQNLNIMSHIIGTYFDKLYFLIKEVPKIRQANYYTSSVNPVPFARHLPQSLGLYVPDTFIDSTIVEKLLNRNETKLFEGDLFDTKNEIYLNLYNNLTNIFKSKGTERAIRNVLRCFNLDDELVQLRHYATSTTYELKNELQQKKINKNFANMNYLYNSASVVYQAKNTANPDSIGYISGTYKGPRDGTEDVYGATVEAEIMFPFYFTNKTPISRNFLSCSLFGLHTVDTGSSHSLLGTTTTTLASNDYANFQVYAVRESEKSKNVYFKLSSSHDPYPIPNLTSSIFFNVYNNNLWNFSVRLKPSNYPMAGLVSGSSTFTYDVIFKGTNHIAGHEHNSFEVSSSVAFGVGSKFLRSPKRIYAGTRRENLTGTVLQPSDVLIGGVKYWTKYLDNGSLDTHSKSLLNSGISGSYWNISPLHASGSDRDLLNLNTLALNWNFEALTSSNADGTFYAKDFSSGSSLIRDNYNWLGKIVGYQHDGYGYNFATSSTDIIDKRFINVFEFVDPEQATSSEMIKILTEDDKVFDVHQTMPDFLITLEKSMQSAISQEMLKFFAGVIDFNNIIGDPVNRYRERYKSLEKLREIFFRRVTKTSNVEKFVDYYKWFDDTISEIISQLVPASSDMISDVMNVVEPHVLERNKYQTKFPTLEFQEPTLEATTYGITELLYPYSIGSTTLPSSPRDTRKHSAYWAERAERNRGNITSSNSTNNTQRETIRRVVITEPYLSRSIPNFKSSDGTVYQNPNQYRTRKLQKLYKDTYTPPASLKIQGGVNFEATKNIHFTYNAVAPAGPVNKDDNIYAPSNVLVSFIEDMAKLPVNNDPKPDWIKTKRHVKVLHGRDFESGMGYKNVKSSLAFPFNIMSCSINLTGGYQDRINKSVSGNITITNLHNDVYGHAMERPMQGPFTEYAVGGHQSRHIALNSGSDTYLTRPEAWKILLGTCIDAATTFEDSGAIAVVGADYPWPEANELYQNPYPLTGAQKAVYFRDFVAKRPVNIKNIKHTTGSTVLGNYNNNYDVVSTFGAFSNPRNFIKNQPSVPAKVFADNHSASTSVRTFLNIRRNGAVNRDHFNWIGEYSLSYLTKSTNRSVIKTRFGAPGGIETLTPGYTDLRSDEFSVYNSLNYRNLTVRKPKQGPSGSKPEQQNTSANFAKGFGTTAIYVSDIHDKDYGLNSHLARHSGRFGRDSLFQTGSRNTPTAAKHLQAPGASYDQLPSFHKIHRNGVGRYKYVGPGDGAQGHNTVTLTSIYDNYYVIHQIPKATTQYSWITASYKTLNERFGFVRADFRTSNSSGMVDSLEFLQSAEQVSYLNSGRRTFGKDERHSGGTPFLKTSFAGLNTNVVDVVLTSSATLGNSTDPLDYLNTDLVLDAVAEGTASLLNAIILNRQGPYGYPSWRMMRQGDHKLMTAYKKNNLAYFVSSTGSYNSHAKYTMPPISQRGRTLTICYDDGQVHSAVATAQASDDSDAPQTMDVTINTIQTIKADFSNNYVYFNLTSMEDNLEVDDEAGTTLAEQIVDSVAAIASYDLNWIIYSENIFPSQRNEFLSQSRNKIGYDNLFWRDSEAERATVGDTFFNSQNKNVSQSCWALDAPTDFLTRNHTSMPKVRYRASVPATSVADRSYARDSLRVSSSGGELQNTYSTYFTSSNHPGRTTDFERAGILTPGALYARKQTISAPTSVAAPSGMEWDLTGSHTGPFDETKQIEVFAGEAIWEAGTKAGIVVKQDSSDMAAQYKFEPHPSEPWFNDYTDFNFLINKVSDSTHFSFVPEYRISNHVDDYLSLGLNNESKYDTFEVPHTNMSSSDNNFYIDYSNSEFLQQFLKIQDAGELEAKEIRLVCSGTIRFNPYKGFYPAQRSLELVEKFYDSFSQSGSWGDPLGTLLGARVKSLYQPLFAPGILYNSIKSGLAVDYPVVTDQSRVLRTQYGTAAQITEGTDKDEDNWALSQRGTVFGEDPGRESFGASGSAAFWDKRLDFQSLIYPENHLNGLTFVDMDSHPSCSVSASSLTLNIVGDRAYSLMARNFFGECGNFFLQDSSFTSLKSKDWVPQKVAPGTYMARIKLRRSLNQSRNYSYETGSSNAINGTFSHKPYTSGGARPIINSTHGAKTFFGHVTQSDTSVIDPYHQLPQDPIRSRAGTQSGDASTIHGGVHETFTMYSRNTAFGPPCSGLAASDKTNIAKYGTETILDSFTGYNGAFTPPYYNGEAWCDLIFTPSAQSASYTLDQIMSETKTVYWRVDPGYASASSAQGHPIHTVLVYDNSNTTHGVAGAIYDGAVINKNSMQLSASINPFGIETVQRIEVDKTGRVLTQQNTIEAQKWIIQPKWETPMVNFNDLSSTRALTSSELSLPANYGRATVPRGMWHQFGIIEPDPNKGIFLEVGDIPQNWLRYHYDVTINNSSYNENLSQKTKVWQDAKSLSDLVGFGESTADVDGRTARLGQLKDSLTVYEAIVAVPYIIKAHSKVDASGPGLSFTERALDTKKFISIPAERYEAALAIAEGTEAGDSLTVSGESIRRQVTLMEKYIFPPELDFIGNSDLDPISMYIFEFEFEFDKDDLSYIWQNVAPRNYKKITKQVSSVAHELLDTEILNDSNLEDNETLRWMIFKVKQRSQKDYYDMVSPNIKVDIPKAETPSTLQSAGFNVMYNWPYDFFSFVEKVSIDAEVLFKQDNDVLVQRDELEKSKQIDHNRIRSHTNTGTDRNTTIATEATDTGTTTTAVTYTQAANVRTDTGKFATMNGDSDSDFQEADIPDYSE
jgi:P2-related tail formation protein